MVNIFARNACDEKSSPHVIEILFLLIIYYTTICTFLTSALALKLKYFFTISYGLYEIINF